jgi:hypothetical protein
MCLDNNRIFNNLYTKYLGLIVDNTLSWRPHIDHLINKLSIACYVIISVKPYVNTNAVIMIYHSFLQTVMDYGIIFWGNPPPFSVVLRYLECKKRQLVLLWDVVIEKPVETCSKN